PPGNGAAWHRQGHVALRTIAALKCIAVTSDDRRWHVAVVVVPPLREGRASTHSIGIVRPRYLANDLMRPHRSAESVSRVDAHPFAGCKHPADGRIGAHAFTGCKHPGYTSAAMHLPTVRGGGF